MQRSRVTAKGGPRTRRARAPVAPGGTCHTHQGACSSTGKIMGTMETGLREKSEKENQNKYDLKVI